MTYAAPLAEMRFVLEEVGGLGDGVPADLVAAILGEAGRFAESVLAPLNQPADRAGSRLENGVVRTPAGFREAYARYVAGGWNGLALSPEYGGQGLPLALAVPLVEMWNSACMSWALCPLLTTGAAHLLQAYGSQAQQRLYLPRLVCGEWTGTMNLTEPQAGSDLGAVRTRAVPAGDHYRITGQKIFITYGDHDLAPNIIHLVLARVPGAPAGSRGLSLFLVPKFLPDSAGRPGARNGVRTLRLEEKLGIHASPTCVLSYEDAVGWRVGEEERGLPIMFAMMNNARLNVGVQGLAIAERAYQAARDFARTRVQGKPPGAEAEGLPILHHPDVRRMLLGMRAAMAAMRALSYYAAGLSDQGRGDPEGAEQRRADLLIPVVKAWCTDQGVAVASSGIQVHGGMGYVEETGAAQHYRDARIAPIYEGTNGIQASDLVGRKLVRDGGAAVKALLGEMQETALAAAHSAVADFAATGRALAGAVSALETATAHLLHADPAEAAAGSVPYLSLFGTTTGGWLLLRLALAAARRREAGGATDPAEQSFLAARRAIARFYAEHFLALAPGQLAAVTGGRTVLDFPPDLL
jgi:alkylation response protein AidB-like acyl-CoA dehydrogenase